MVAENCISVLFKTERQKVAGWTSLIQVKLLAFRCIMSFFMRNKGVEVVRKGIENVQV